MKSSKRHLVLGLFIRAGLSLCGAGAILFVSAGTCAFPEAWFLLALIVCLGLSFGYWLYIQHSEQFFNRLNYNEPDPKQQRIISLIGVVLCISLLISGLDKRFQWSSLGVWRYVFAGVCLIPAILIYRNVFLVNPFLSNTVKIHKEQHIVSKGMYGIVRHPMYLANCLTYAAGLAILGSLVTIPLLVIFVVLLSVRAAWEENQLLSAFPNYAEYMKNVKYRIIPLVY